MNINDIENNTEMPENIWAAIFEKQNALAQKYKDIEGMGDLLDTTTNNINTAKGQKWIKDFAWRVTEELAEAQEARNGYKRTRNPVYDQHYIEELIDALHFLTELTIITGYDYSIIPEVTIHPNKVYSFWDTVYNLGLMCNCLKNKPWKQTQMLTDKNKFEFYLRSVWFSMIETFYLEKLTDEDIYNFYFKKNAVNQFRIRSKY